MCPVQSHSLLTSSDDVQPTNKQIKKIIEIMMRQATLNMLKHVWCEWCGTGEQEPRHQSRQATSRDSFPIPSCQHECLLFHSSSSDAEPFLYLI